MNPHATIRSSNRQTVPVELNVGVINIFLEQISRELPVGVHAVRIWDGAGYHTSPLVMVRGNVSLIELVPYSPELNPVKNLWHYLRSHYWSLRVYADIDALEEAAMDARRRVCLVPELIRSTCHAPYVDHQSRRIKFLGTASFVTVCLQSQNESWMLG